jgi:membrane-bound serine protease (ClpP class)
MKPAPSFFGVGKRKDARSKDNQEQHFFENLMDTKSMQIAIIENVYNLYTDAAARSGWEKNMTNLLFEPNVAYMLLMGSIIMGVLALYTPGTGLIEIGSLFTLVLAVYGFYNMQVNAWAFIPLLLGIAPFILPLFWKKPLKRSQDIAIVATSFVAMLVGSFFLVRSGEGQKGMDLLVIVLTSTFAAGVFWLISHKGIDAIRRRPSHDLDRLTGMTGVATTDIYEEGSVYAAGEQWSARSIKKIRAGSHVKVIRRAGFTLEVELSDQEKPAG